MKKVLIHICCAHCAAYTVAYWREQGYEVGGYWHNPNIHPFSEHQARLESTRELAKRLDFPLIEAEGYEMPEYFRRVASHEEDRCRYCFEMRLMSTAEAAKANGYGAFTSTLLISPHQAHDILKEMGEKVGRETGVEFLYADLRKRYSDSRHITKPMELYRQQYCGCLYSEWERYRGESQKL